ncbi:MAG TPA: HEAT repeat domain-containing protein, partial [Bacteroidota bacterium]
TMDSLTGVFRMPVDVEVTTAAGSALHHAAVWTKDTVLSFPCAERPVMVLFDPANWLMKELHFEKPREEWKYQAVHATNPIDRLRAVKELGGAADSDDVVPVFAQLAEHDAFYGVRRQAVSALGELIIRQEAMKQTRTTALLAAARDRRSSVRTAAIEQLGALRGDSVVACLRAALEDSSYAVVGAALGALAKADSAHAGPILADYLQVPSRRNTIASSALSGLNRVDSARAITEALRMIRTDDHAWGRYRALQILRGHASARKEFVALLATLARDNSRLIRATAIRYLGEYGDSSSLPVLESIAADPANDQAKEAKEAIEKIKEPAGAKHG